MLKIKDYAKVTCHLDTKGDKLLFVTEDCNGIAMCEFDNDYLFGQRDYKVFKTYGDNVCDYVRVQKIHGIDFGDKLVICNITLLEE